MQETQFPFVRKETHVLIPSPTTWFLTYVSKRHKKVIKFQQKTIYLQEYILTLFRFSNKS